MDSEMDNEIPTFFLSSRGGKKMGLKGYVYSKDGENKDTVYWRCEDRKCKGRVVMKDSRVIKDTVHDHGPDTANRVLVNRYMFLVSTSFLLV